MAGVELLVASRLSPSSHLFFAHREPFSGETDQLESPLLFGVLADTSVMFS